MSIIYLITNTINDKKYVGKTMYSLNERWVQHVRVSKRQKVTTAFAQAIRKHGASNFEASLLEECLAEELSDRETYWIGLLGTHTSNGQGYNMTFGGECGSHPMSPEARKKISQAKKGKRFSNEHKNALRVAAKLRKPCSESTRFKLSLIHSTFKHKSETKKQISETLKGRIISHSARLAISMQVSLVDDLGNVLKTYDSVTIAASSNGTSPASIKKSIDLKKKVAGLNWRRLGGIFVSNETRQKLAIARRSRRKLERELHVNI